MPGRHKQINTTKPQSGSDLYSKLERVFFAMRYIGAGIGLFFAANLLGPLLVSVWLLFRGTNENELETAFQSTYVLFWTVLLTYGFAVYGVLIVLKSQLKSWADIGLTRRIRSKDVQYALAGYVVYFLLFAAVFTIVSQLNVINLEQEQQLGFTQGIDGVKLVLAFVSLVILPPLAEEILFRGFIYRGMRRKLRPLSAGVISSILFGVVHLEFATDQPLHWAAALDTFLLALVLVYVTEKTGSLWPAIIIHAIKNGIAFTVLFVIR